MSDDGGTPPVGSLAEEAAKLFAALQGAAGESGGSAHGDHQADGADGAAGFLGEHLATGSRECTVCPVCQAIAFARQVSPEVRQHLSQAASSVAQAVTALLAAQPGSGSGSAAADPESGVQHIDLDDDEAWEDD
jgi:hypothetical protein